MLPIVPVLVGDPMAGGSDPLTGFFNTAAFARPTRGSYGNVDNQEES